MLNRTRNQPAIDTLIIEHSFRCNRNCEGCYQKNRDVEEVITPEVYELLVETVCSHGYAKSIIFSFNDTIDCDWNIVDAVGHICNKWEVEANLACHSAMTVDKLLSLSKVWNGHLYLSTAKPYNRFKEKAGRIEGNIVINKQLPPDISDIEKTVHSLYQSITSVYGQSGSHIDEFHLLMPKYHPMLSLTFADDVHKVFEQLTDKVVDWRFEVSLDRCVQNTHCGANNTSLVVWPDGSVVGCPYALKADTGPAVASQDKPMVVASIINNMREALTKETYGTDRCVGYCAAPPQKQMYQIVAEMM